MFFKNLRLASRFGKAHALMLDGKYEDSYKLLVSILEAGTEEYLLPFIHDDLGFVEYKRGNYAESMQHMDYCIRHSVENPDLWGDIEDAKRLERIHWYYKASENKLSEYQS